MEPRTCAVGHAFASGVNGLLALLLGRLELTVFTARAVPITVEEQTNTPEATVVSDLNTETRPQATSPLHHCYSWFSLTS